MPPERLPENTQPRSVTAFVALWPMKPPKWEPEEEIAAATSQLSIRFGEPPIAPTRPEQCILPETVPATFRFRIVAPETRENGAMKSAEPDKVTVSVFDPPSKTENPKTNEDGPLTLDDIFGKNGMFNDSRKGGKR